VIDPFHRFFRITVGFFLPPILLARIATRGSARLSWVNVFQAALQRIPGYQLGPVSLSKSACLNGSQTGYT
jgi:uncharacterized membrane protein YqaE (UPF0057 family)